jgi:hypothetical protein
VLKEVPGRRCDHGLAAVEGVVYAFGGAADVENESVLTAVTVVGEFELEGKTLSRGDGIRWRRLRVTGDVPCARSDFVMTSLDGKVVVQGGKDMDGNLLDDMYSLDPATGVWTTMYRSDNAWQKNAHAVSCLVGKRLIVASAKQEGSKLDELRILEFGKIAEQHALIKDMEKRIVKELKALEAFNKESLLNLALDPTKEANEEKQREVLLKVKGCIYQVKVDQPKIELQLDVLKDALSYMHKQGIGTEKMEKEMKDVMENFGSVKKQAPLAAEVIKPVQQREADKIKAEVASFTLKVKGMQKEFLEKPFMVCDAKEKENFVTFVEGKYTSIVEMKTKLRETDKELNGLIHFATVFEFLEIT